MTDLKPHLMGNMFWNSFGAEILAVRVWITFMYERFARSEQGFLSKILTLNFPVDYNRVASWHRVLYLATYDPTFGTSQGTYSRDELVRKSAELPGYYKMTESYPINAGVDADKSLSIEFI